MINPLKKMNPKYTLTALALLLATSAAQADVLPSTVGVHIASVHSNHAQDWNNRNPGAYARWGALGAGGAVVGTYYNSERRQSVYAGYVLETADGMFAVAGGAITGYSSGKVVPFVAASMRIDTSAVLQGSAIRLHLLPKPPRNPTAAAAMHLSFEMSW
jgi:hypothetical protein